MINIGVIKLHIKKKEKEKKYNNTQKKNSSHKLKHRGFVIRKKNSQVGRYKINRFAFA